MRNAVKKLISIGDQPTSRRNFGKGLFVALTSTIVGCGETNEQKTTTNPPILQQEEKVVEHTEPMKENTEPVEISLEITPTQKTMIKEYKEELKILRSIPKGQNEDGEFQAFEDKQSKQEVICYYKDSSPKLTERAFGFNGGKTAGLNQRKIDKYTSEFHLSESDAQKLQQAIFVQECMERDSNGDGQDDNLMGEKMSLSVGGDVYWQFRLRLGGLISGLKNDLAGINSGTVVRNDGSYNKVGSWYIDITKKHLEKTKMTDQFKRDPETDNKVLMKRYFNSIKIITH